TGVPPVSDGQDARSTTSETEEEVAAKNLAVGDMIRIRPGDNVAADGVIVSGQGSFNQANITGESLPVDKKPGDEVFAGTQNLTGVLEVRVTRAGEDTTLGRVRELILAAEKTKLPIMRIIDQYMVYYTPLVLVLGAMVWAFTRDLDRVITVLVIGCPCAFILASPSAMVAALSAAARLGILIKNVGDIELAARINAFVFDKTGTLTTGKLAVSRLAPLNGTKPAELLRLAASAERYSNHPTAKALAGLKENHVRRIAMVSGDRQPVATRVAREIGCEEVVGECLPQNKVEFVREMKRRGYRVAVVGDGVNDAPALAAGDMGIAMGAAGSEVAIHSATVALMNNDLRRLPFLVKLSRSTRAVINQNFLFGVAFIIGGLTLAAFGKINPI